MTRFLNGPAQGVTLLLKRAPITLTAVQDSTGKWDALDHPDDSIRPGETAHQYKRATEPTVIHLNAGKRSGFYQSADYIFINPTTP